jgi:two-component system cell cycle sensor histidine kinase/response regulator CckA
LDNQVPDFIGLTQDSVVVLDRLGRFTFVNASAAEALGRPAEAIVGRDYRTAFPDLVGSVLEEACLRAARDQQFTRAEGLHERSGRWFEIRAYPSPTALTAFLVDITARKNVEASLLASEARLLRAQAVAQVGSWELDLVANVMWASEEAFRIYGIERTAPALPFAVAREVPVPEDRARMDQALHDLLVDGRTYDIEFRIRRSDGDIRVIHSTAEVARDGSGKPIRVVGTIQDVSERVASEQERARLLSAIDQASDVVVLQHLDGTISYVNRSFTRLYGYDPGEVVSQDAALINGPDGLSAWPQVRDRLARGDTWSGSLVNWRRDGSTVEVMATISPVRDERGEIVGVVQVQRDVSLERELEARLQQIDRLESIGRFAGGIAHDFNNVLTAINGYADLLAAELGDDPRADDAREIAHAGHRAADLTRQLLAFARRQVLSTRPIDIDAVVEGLEPMLGRLIGEDVTLVTQGSPSPAVVEADPSQLEQVLVNLTVNARDAMPDGGRLTITTSLPRADLRRRHHLSGPAVLLTVADTGTGMTREVLDHMFEPFFTTKASHGTGLGLATVHGIIAQSGGEIWAESSPGKGTTFSILLPRSTRAAEPLSAPAHKPASRAMRATILVVEDDPDARRFAVRVLEHEGYDVLVAGSPGQAIALGRSEESLDLLITDLVMPGGDGRELARRLIADRPGLPVLLISGYDSSPTAEIPEDERLTFLAKPFAPNELIGRVREALSR